MSSSPAMTVRSRRTRFVCIADTHNRPVKLPKGDVLIHAGDLTNQGSYSELAKAVQWLEKTDFEAKIVIAGNHDITLDRDFYARSGSSFHSQNPQDSEECISLLTASPTITYLCHSQATFNLTKPDGPRTTFTVFGSPYSPRVGLWAFDYARPGGASDPHPEAMGSEAMGSEAMGSEASIQTPPPSEPTAAELWSAIPLDTDILITHTPPNQHCDRSAAHGDLGCEDLRRALWRVRPRLHVCGHVHESHGAERVRWAIDGPREEGSVLYAEAGAEAWADPSPASNKISLVDLTARGHNAPLDNDGSRPESAPQSASDSQGEEEVLERDRAARCSSDGINKSPLGLGLGLGGDPEAPPPCDRAALRGRMGRRETCVVNAAIAATSWPHVGGKRFHKPVVVDLDLPVWGAQDGMGTT